MVIGSFFQDLDDEVGNGPAILRMHVGAAGGSRRCVGKPRVPLRCVRSLLSRLPSKKFSCSAATWLLDEFSQDRALSGRSAHKGIVVPLAAKAHDKAEPCPSTLGQFGTGRDGRP